MDLQQLKTEFPRVYAAAVALGVQQERERVSAHVTMGEQVDDIGLALHSIRRGVELAAVMRFYLAAGRNRRDIAAWQADCDEADAVLLNVQQSPSSYVDPLEKQVSDRFLALIDRSAGDARIEDLEDV